VSGRLLLLGSPRLEGAARGSEALPPGRPLTLLVYLASQGDWVSRERVALLYWPERDGGSARHNLRQLLYRVRGAAWSDGLEVEADRLRWRIATDVTPFRQAVELGDWQGALALRRGPFADGLSQPGAPGWEDWLELERGELDTLWLRALRGRADALERSGDPVGATELWLRQLQHDPLDEVAVEGALRTLLRDGARARAHELHRSFAERLRDELGLDPPERFARLFEREEGAAVAGLRIRPEEALLGREVELSDVWERLGDPECRLLTLVAPGGFGKTRLALEVAQSAAGRFPDGCAVIELAGVEGEAPLVAAVVASLTGTASEGIDVGDRLQRALADRRMLLVLDNFEHLLEHAPILDAMLAASEGLKLLVTSRVRLQLRREWTLEIGGLALPTGSDDPDFAQAPAVRLFVRAARKGGAFGYDPALRPALTRLCRALGGMPLGLELAASWLAVYTLDEIAELAASDPGAIGGSERDRPERHRDLGVIFEQSWSLLSPALQRSARRLSVFRDGFERDAARQVADAAPGRLLDLLHASLIQRQPSGRLAMHELIRQFAARELASRPEEQGATRASLLRWAVAFAEGARGQIFGSEGRAWVSRLDLEIHNLRAALDWALQAELPVEASQLVVALNPYWDVRLLRREAVALCGRLLALRPEGEATIAWSRVMGVAALHRQRLGELEAADALHRESLAIKEQLGDRRGTAVTLTNLALLAKVRGELDAAIALDRRALALFREVGSAADLSGVTAELMQLHLLRGEIDLAEAVGVEGLQLDPEGGRGRSIKLSHLAEAARLRGDVRLARERAQAGLEIAEQLDDSYLIPLLRARLAAVALTDGDEGGALVTLRLLLSGLGASTDPGHRVEAAQALALLARRSSDVSAAAELRGAAAALLRDAPVGRSGILAASAPLAPGELDPPNDEALATLWQRGAADPAAVMGRAATD
jgi:predicted ATPase/DNA-binding SARP family transcriptional activator